MEFFTSTARLHVICREALVIDCCIMIAIYCLFTVQRTRGMTFSRSHALYGQSQQ